MSLQIDAREVLMHLNNLGYKNINVIQLKDFIKDLKKLIKYESRQLDKGYKEELNSSQEHIDQYNRGDFNRYDDVFLHLHKQSTISSKEKEVQPKRKDIILKISKPRITKFVHRHCKHVDEVEINEIQKESAVPTGAGYMPICQVPPNSEVRLFKSKEVKPSSSKEFIKVCPPKVTKSDPVSLYHQYKDIWRHTNIPGTNSRNELRWSIRERMLSGPKVQIPVAKRKTRAWR